MIMKDSIKMLQKKENRNNEKTRNMIRVNIENASLDEEVESYIRKGRKIQE